MLDDKIKLAAEEFRITRPEDWTNITAEQVRKVHGCGPSTVDHLRLYLAARGLTLRNDATPAYWQQNLAAARIGGQVAKTDMAVVLPFVVLVDNQEKYPFTFQGFRADADQSQRPLIVPTRIVSMGPTHGDYGIEGLEGEVHVDRKSEGDAAGTFLARDERLDRWLRTLEFLAGIETAAVVIECTLGKLITGLQARGSRPRGDLQKTLHRQVLAWQQDTRVPFVFCDSRRLAEMTTLAILRRHYRHQNKKAGKQEREISAELDAVVDSM